MWQPCKSWENPLKPKESSLFPSPAPFSNHSVALMKENRNDDSDDFLGRIRHAVAHVLPRPAPHEAVSHFRRPMRALSQSQDLEGLSELAASRLYVFSFFLFLVLLMHVAFFFSQVADANRWGGKLYQATSTTCTTRRSGTWFSRAAWAIQRPSMH